MHDFRRRTDDSGVTIVFNVLADLVDELFHEGLPGGNERHRYPRPLVKVVHRYFRHRDLEVISQTVAKALHNHSFLFERLRSLDVELEDGNADDHNGERLAASC